MERGPLIELLQNMVGTDKELTAVIWGEEHPMEIRNVEAVDELKSAQGIRITTKQNYIWLDSSHVSAAWQARSDL